MKRTTTLLLMKWLERKDEIVERWFMLMCGVAIFTLILILVEAMV